LVITTFVRTYIVTTEIQAFSFYPKLWDSSGAVAVFPSPRVTDCLIYRIVFFTGYPDYPQNEH
ncbi:MAG: hypothetical protein JAZ02_18465, partial [Candidatus Thiodiazotropha endolucinida]|nr:hypothetical protein [Candidatus Thiodiazotropha endolucinida]